MLVRFLTFTTGNPTHMTAAIYDNTGTIKNLTSVTVDKAWFSLANVTTGTAAPITINTVTKSNAVNGIIDIEIAELAAGAILCLYGSATVGELGAVIGTTTMDTGVGTVTTAGQDLYITAPTLNRTKDIPYELTITGAEENGTPITYTLSNIELTINGIDVNKLVITLVTPNTDNKYDYGEVIDFNVKYYHDDTVLQFDGATDDAVIAALAPKTLPYS